MTDCIFCKIARAEILAKKLYEDDDLLVFHDIHPAAPVHFLIIPKQHIDSLAQVNDEHVALLGKMLRLAPVLAQQAGATQGFKTVINTGRDGGQEIYHLHLHVMGGRTT